MSELQNFINWYGFVDIDHCWKNGKEHIEYQHIDTKDIRLTIDGVEVFEFTRKSRCCDASVYDEPEHGHEQIRCDKCKEKALTYLDHAS